MGILPILAILAVTLGIWWQVFHIFKTKRTEGLSFWAYSLLGVGLGILTYQAIVEESLVFFVRQVSTLIPVGIVLLQILIYRR